MRSRVPLATYRLQFNSNFRLQRESPRAARHGLPQNANASKCGIAKAATHLRQSLVDKMIREKPVSRTAATENPALNRQANTERRTRPETLKIYFAGIRLRPPGGLPGPSGCRTSKPTSSSLLEGLAVRWLGSNSELHNKGHVSPFGVANPHAAHNIDPTNLTHCPEMRTCPFLPTAIADRERHRVTLYAQTAC